MVNRVPGLSDAVDFVTQTRFRKLYRKLYNSFFFIDFIHKKDHEEVVRLLNERITQVELQLNTAVAANTAMISAQQASLAVAQSTMYAAVVGHSHGVQVVPLVGSGTTITTIAPPPPPPPPAVPPATQANTASAGSMVIQTSKAHKFHTQKNGILRAEGPQLSPLLNVPVTDVETLADATILSVDAEGSI